MANRFLAEQGASFYLQFWDKARAQRNRSPTARSHNSRRPTWWRSAGGRREKGQRLAVNKEQANSCSQRSSTGIVATVKNMVNIKPPCFYKWKWTCRMTCPHE